MHQLGAFGILTTMNELISDNLMPVGASLDKTCREVLVMGTSSFGVDTSKPLPKPTLRQRLNVIKLNLYEKFRDFLCDKFHLMHDNDW